MPDTLVATTEPPERPSPPGEPDAFRKSRQRMGAMLVFMGVLHFVAPKPFMKIVPRWLGRERFWTYLSGVWELSSGALLLSGDPKLRRAGGAAAAATIVAVYPANIQMAIDTGRPRDLAGVGAWLRLPFQFPMIATALRQARGPQR